MRKVLYILGISLTAIAGRTAFAQTEDMAGQYIVVAKNCIQIESSSCAADINALLAEIRSGFPLELQDDEIAKLVIALVDALDGTTDLSIFATVAGILDQIAFWSMDAGQSATIRAMAGIIRRGELVVFEPDGLLASAN